MLGSANKEARERNPRIELEVREESVSPRDDPRALHGDVSAVETARQEQRVPDFSPRCDDLNTPVLLDHTLRPVVASACCCTWVVRQAVGAWR